MPRTGKNVVIDNNPRQAACGRPACARQGGAEDVSLASLNRHPGGIPDAELRQAQRPQALPAAQTQELKLAALNDHVGYFLRRLQVALFKDFIRTLAPMDVRPAQYSVLILIAANPGRSQAAIGRALGIERARLARMLHELERRKWIERRASVGDGRSHSLFLTGTGERALARIKALSARHEKQMVEFIGPKRRMLLLELLREFG
jgi:DNA-binding MarR family transcriptional regulator